MRRRPAHNTQRRAAKNTDPSASVEATQPLHLLDILLEPVNPTYLIWFRRVFALAVIADNLMMAQREEMSDYFGPAGRLHFAHEWPLPHPPAMSAGTMECLPYALIGAAVAFGSGLLPCTGLAAYTVGWSYLNLVDAARYVNHFYLYSLIGALLLLAALDTHVRRIHLLLLRTQWSMAYFFAGCAKCSSEFLVRREPLRSYLRMAVAAGAPLHPLAGVLDAEFSVAAAAVFALIFDLGAAFALWYRPTFRPWCALAAAFHLTNALMFRTIGSFPFVSLASCLLFAECRPAAQPGVARVGRRSRARAALLCSSLAAWLALHVLLPLRHHLLSNDVAWTKIGNEFAWRMMADMTDGWVSLELRVSGAERTFRVYPQSAPPAPVTLPSHSIRQLLTSPTNLQQYIQAEAAAASRALLGASVVNGALVVYAECWKSVNGRPYQRWCDPTYDFGAHGGAQAGGGEGGGRRQDSDVHAGLLGALFGTSRVPVWAVPPRWMLPRLMGADGGPSEADVAADTAARKWRGQGYTAEAFVDAPGRPWWRDTILRSSGYREARLLCTYGQLVLRPAGPADHDAGWTRLAAGDWAGLQVGSAHEIRNDGAVLAPASWVYVMR